MEYENFKSILCLIQESINCISSTADPNGNLRSWRASNDSRNDHSHLVLHSGTGEVMLRDDGVCSIYGQVTVIHTPRQRLLITLLLSTPDGEESTPASCFRGPLDDDNKR